MQTATLLLAPLSPSAITILQKLLYAQASHEASLLFIRDEKLNIQAEFQHSVRLYELKKFTTNEI
jgi:hypothetical protein